MGADNHISDSIICFGLMLYTCLLVPEFYIWTFVWNLEVGNFDEHRVSVAVRSLKLLGYYFYIIPQC